MLDIDHTVYQLPLPTLTLKYAVIYSFSVRHVVNVSNAVVNGEVKVKIYESRENIGDYF